MKHVGELAVIGALFNAVETRRVHTTQGRRYLTNRMLFRRLLLHTYYRIARVAELHLNMEW